MSDADDVWRPAIEDATAVSPVSEGRAAYGDGLWINQAFSLEVTFRLGVALLRERPGLVLGGGVITWFLFSLPTFVSLPLSVASGVVRGSGGAEETAVVLDLAANLTTLAVYVLAFPFQWVAVAGALKALARHVEGEDAPASLLWTSWREGLYAMVYRFLTGLILAAVGAAILLPAAALFGVLVALEHEGAGAIVLFAGLLAALVAYVYVMLPLALGVLPCAIDGAGPLEAFRIAWTAGSGARATLFVFALVFGMLSIAGACVFCVGQAPVFGLVLGGAAAGWLLYARSSDTLRQSPFFQRNPVDVL